METPIDVSGVSCCVDVSGGGCCVDVSGGGCCVDVSGGCCVDVSGGSGCAAAEVVLETLSETVVPEKKSVVARRMIAEVEEALRTESAASVSARFSEYQLEFPKLFAILLSRDYPRDVLSLMIAQLEKVENGRTSQHDASVAVGSVLVAQFVKPQFDHASPK